MFSPHPLARPSRSRPARRGSVATETLLVLPLLLLVVLGMVGLADLIISEQLLAEAGGRAARAAALGKSDEEIAAAARSVLGDERAANATICVRPVNGRCDEPVPPGGLFEVRIEIAARHATTTRLALIDPDEVLVGRAVMQRE